MCRVYGMLYPGIYIYSLKTYSNKNSPWTRGITWNIYPRYPPILRSPIRTRDCTSLTCLVMASQHSQILWFLGHVLSFFCALKPHMHPFHMPARLLACPVRVHCDQLLLNTQASLEASIRTCNTGWHVNISCSSAMETRFGNNFLGRLLLVPGN